MNSIYLVSKKSSFIVIKINCNCDAREIINDVDRTNKKIDNHAVIQDTY